MAKLTLQEQLLKAGLVTSKKAAKVERTAKKSRVQAREARAAVEENKKAQLERDKQLSEQQKQAALAKEYKAQVKQLIEMNRITIANGDIGFNFTDGNLIKKIFVDKLTQAQLINGRLAIARLLVDNNSEGEYAIIPASLMSTRTPSSSSSRLMLTIGLCFLVALMEGLDLQAAGIAAGGIAQAFALDKMQMGWIFSAGILGLLPGALVGGMLADRYGRKRILIGSVALFGLFSLATAIAWDFPSLVFARLMTGVGLGAALPNLIALTSEAAGPRFRGTAVSLMYCGVPIGAALAATLGFAGANLAWQTVFWVGGVVPLILVPLLMRWLPESAVFAGEKQAAPPLRALFAPETATATLLLWLCYFFTLLVVYMLINWLPLLLVEQGFQPSQAAGVMFALQMGAASGTLMLGALMDKLRPVTMSLLIYSGMLASLLALGTVSSFNGMLLAGFVAGLFATGGQSVLYALAPLFYSSQIRATGVGTAVAVGRLGAMSGPLLAGKMLALGTGTVGVMAASAPGILVAGLAVFILMSRRSRMQPCADA